MTRRFTILGRAAVLSLTFGAAAAAEDGGPGARGLYQEGARLYNLGQYEDAVRAFEGAYAISGSKPLLFNIAQAHRLAGPPHCERALRAYESYLREEADPENRDEIEERIGEMRRCVERIRESELAMRKVIEARSQPSPSPAPGPQVERPASRRAPAAVVVGGASLLFVGAGLYTAARIKFEHERDNCPCPEGSFTTWQNLSTASYVLMSAGGAVAVAGISWWIVARPNAASYRVTAGPSGVHVAGTF
jgi:tetratricopeptide (TPR) repeat protein